MANPFIGEITFIGFNFAPRAWALCDGQLLAISSNTALFSLIGTTFGGDGRTTFALPDLRSRSPLGVGSGPGLDTITWGMRGGGVSKTLTVSSIPSHTHLWQVTGGLGTNARAAGRKLAGITGEETNPNSKGDRAFTNNAASAGTMNSQTLSNTGGGQSYNMREPYLGLYCCIAMQGVYPSRS